MRWKYIAYVVGSLILFFGLTMLVPLICGIWYWDPSIVPLIKALGITTTAGLILFLLFRKARVTQIRQREGMAIVSLGWTAVGVFGALPFYLADPSWTFVDAFFESVSGFTTTGASVMTDIEAMPKGLLLWRSFIQWLGGMGIIVLSIAVLPFLGVGGMQLYKAEVPSPVPDKLKPRIRETAMILWKVYVLFTGLEIILLLFGGFDLFDAFCHAFTTLPTGGFSTRNASIAHYNSVYIDGVIIFFMIMAGINFSLHFQLIRGKPLAFWKDPECRFFLLLLLLLTLVVSWNVWHSVYDSVAQALRFGGFQVVSIITTTGYVTADYEQWPAMSQLILLICMFIGASAGSTGGGVKCLRVMLCFKFCYRSLFSMVHPHAVTTVKISGQKVSDDVLTSVMGFLALYISLFAISAVLLAGMGADWATCLGAVASAIGNIGPGFGMVGPVENYALIPDPGKWLLAWCMLLGRLEIFTLLILLVPEFWRK